MKHQIVGRRLGRPTGHRLALYRNLVADLFRYSKMVTTEAKAKEVRGLAEKIITLGKDNTLSSRRRALTFITDKNLVDKLFTEIAPKYATTLRRVYTIIKVRSQTG